MGASNGGRIAVDFALEHPEKVDALVLVGPALSGYGTSEERHREVSKMFSAARTEGVSRGVEMWMEDPFWAPAENRKLAREKVRNILTENLPKVLSLVSMQNLGMAPAPSVVERLHRIDVPTLVVVGERDHADNLAIASLLEREVPRSSKVMLPGTGHLPMVEMPQEFDTLVLGFLRERAANVQTD
jgi:pimeloyl-ACP methyl ester carboxylesterase